ncbi:MAG: hypothetical protein WB974_12455 [Acidobacteriaceae bacterium]
MSAPAQSVLAAPSRAPWSIRLFSLPTVLALLLVYLLFWLSIAGGGPVHVLADNDLGWHLRDAGALLHTGHFIRADAFTFTVGGKPWIDFEWLGELPFYLASQWLGERGLYLLTMLTAGAIVAGIFLLARMRSRNSWVAFFCSILALLLTTVSLFPRPLLFGWLFLVVETGILWGLESGRDWTAALPLLFLLWINTHGSWLIGFVLMVVFFACGFVQGEWGNLIAPGWTGPTRRKLIAIACLSFAALFINPYGWKLVAYPLDVAFRQKETLQHIAEWASLDFHSARGIVVLGIFLLLAILTLVRKSRWVLADVAFTAIALYGAVTRVRFLFLIAILVVPLLAKQMAEPEPRASETPRDRRWLSAAVIALILAAMALQFPSRQRLHAGIAAMFPERALPYVRTLAGRGPLFNHFEWGGYLEWQAPQVKEFIDPRNDIFVHAGVMSDYLRARNGPELFAVLNQYQIRYAVLAETDLDADLLSTSAGWRRTYDDGQAVVFERVEPRKSAVSAAGSPRP